MIEYATFRFTGNLPNYYAPTAQAYRALRDNNLAVFKKIINTHHNLNATFGTAQWSLLMWALSLKKESFWSFLLEKSVNVHYVTPVGEYSALQIALSLEDIKAVSVLLSFGAHHKLTLQQRVSLLLYVMRQDSFELMELLLRSFQLTGRELKVLFVLTVLNNKGDMIRFLLGEIIEPQFKTRKSFLHLALHVAKEKNNSEIINILEYYLMMHEVEPVKISEQEIEFLIALEKQEYPTYEAKSLPLLKEKLLAGAF